MAQGFGNMIAGGVPVDIAMDSMGYDLDEEDNARIRLLSLMKEGATYDAARVYILADANPLEIERVSKVLDLFKPEPKPTPVPPTPVEQLYNAPQAPAQPPVETPPSADTPMKADLFKWQTKALKRLKGGKPAACEFDSDHIPDSLAGAIAGALDAAQTVEEVKSAFNDALVWSQYP
jgi:hypothetical protein